MLKKNPPSESHLRRVWKDQIKSAHVILSALLKEHGTSFNDESLITLLSEVESVVNSRSLALETLSVIVIFEMRFYLVQSTYYP